jgi:hypothetical protein
MVLSQGGEKSLLKGREVNLSDLKGGGLQNVEGEKRSEEKGNHKLKK